MREFRAQSYDLSSGSRVRERLLCHRPSWPCRLFCPLPCRQSFLADKGRGSPEAKRSPLPEDLDPGHPRRLHPLHHHRLLQRPPGHQLRSADSPRWLPFFGSDRDLRSTLLLLASWQPLDQSSIQQSLQGQCRHRLLQGP